MKRYVLVLLAVGLVMTAASAQAPLPLPRATLPPLAVDGANIDEILNALPIYPDVRVGVANIELTDTLNNPMYEPGHTCATGSPGNSVWFAVYNAPGKLTLDTTGSNFVTASGTNSDTVISVYALVGDPISFTADNFVSVACHDGGAKPGKIKKLNVTQRVYIIQVSRADTTEALTGPSTIALKAKYTATNPIKGDALADARPLKFPFSFSINSMLFSTVEFDEPINPQIMPGIPMSRSIWYKFSLDSASSLGLMLSTDTLANAISLFRREQNGVLTPISMTLPMSDMLLLAKGDYRLRIGLPATLSSFLSLTSISLEVASASISGFLFMSPNNLGFATHEQTGSAAGSLEGWTVKNASPLSSLVCGPPELTINRCGYKIVSVGPDENTIVKSKRKLSTIKLKANDLLVVGVQGPISSSNVHLVVKVDMRNAQGGKFVRTFDIYPMNGSLLTSGTVMTVIPKAFTPKKLILKITNKTPVQGDYVVLDTVGVYPLRHNNPGRAADVFVLP